MEGNFFFLDWFDEPSAIGKKWVKSKAKKEGVTDDLSGYNGELAGNHFTRIIERLVLGIGNVGDNSVTRGGGVNGIATPCRNREKTKFH